MPLTAEQLAIRKTRITATDAGAIIGVSPWRNAADVWLEKVCDVDPLPDNEAIGVGNMLESPLIDWCADSLGLRPDRELGTIIHPQHDWLCATPDAGIVGQLRGIEAKTAGVVRGFADRDEWGDIDSDQVPPWYWVQCQIQMACAGWDAVWLAALVSGRDPARRRYFIARNNNAIGMLIERLGEWRERHIIGRERPADVLPDGDMLTRIRRTPGKVARVDASLVREYQLATEAAKLADERRERAKAALLYSGPDCDAFASDAGCYTYMRQSRKGIDLERLRSEFPEAAEACAKTTTFPVLRAAKALKGIV